MQKKYFLIVGGLVVFFILVSPLSEASKHPVLTMQRGIQMVKGIGTSPTPYPLSDITIPGLKKRTYNGELGERKLFANNPSYNTYLTSYRSDNLKINALLTEPKSEKPTKGYPAIVFIHGYIPPQEYRTTEKYEDYVDYLARNGYVVLKIDLRGHGASEGTATGAYFSSDYIVDTLNAYKALRKSGFVDPNRIGLWGHSMAGNVILRTLAVKPEIPAAVIWAGAVYTYEDRERYGINDSSYVPPVRTGTPNPTASKRQRITELYGSFDPTKTFWKEFTAISYLKDINSAIEIHHAVDDSVVNIGYSRDLMKLLDKTSVKHQLYEYPSGGHNITGTSFGQAMDRTVEFYDANLK